MDSFKADGEAGSAGRGVMDTVRDRATAQLSTQKDKATDGLGSIARAVRQSTQSFRDNEQTAVGEYVERAADQIDRFAERLRNRDVGELLRDTQAFARRKPAVFLGVAFAAGMIAARFLKSSSNGRGYTGGL